jgi:hypothetical protein
MKRLFEAYSVAAARLPVMRLPKTRQLTMGLLKMRPAEESRWCCPDAAHCFPAAMLHFPQRDYFVPWKTERSCLPRSTAGAELRERCWLESLFGCSLRLPEALYKLPLPGLRLALRRL